MDRERQVLTSDWSARTARYRLTYFIHHDQVLLRVVRSSHRSDVYL